MPDARKSPITPRDEYLAQLDRWLHNGNAPIAVALADLDQFEEVNAKHGFEAGDAVLVAWETVLKSNLDDAAVVHRLGGDEYGVSFPGKTAETALVLMEEIRRHFVAREIEGIDQHLSVSVGIAANPPHADTAEGLWRRAGEALMRAKRHGANQVSIYVEEKMTLKSNYYSRASLDRLAKLSVSSNRTEASLLREALDDLFSKYNDRL